MWCFPINTRSRSPPPTCTRCRGRICTIDMTCDICADWSAAQWEQSVKKRSYKDRKKPSPRAETLWEFCNLALLLLPALQGGRGRRRGLRVHLVLGLERLPPLPLDLGPARGVGVSLGFRLLRASALLLLHLLRELAKWELLVRSGLPFPVPLPRLSLPIPRRTFDDVRNRERLRSLAHSCYPPVVPDLRIEEH